jgi:hypothetical protein
MKERFVCLSLALKGLLARAVHDDLTTVLGSDAIADSTVTKDLHQWQFLSILVDPRGMTDDHCRSRHS